MNIKEAYRTLTFLSTSFTEIANKINYMNYLKQNVTKQKETGVETEEITPDLPFGVPMFTLVNALEKLNSMKSELNAKVLRAKAALSEQGFDLDAMLEEAKLNRQIAQALSNTITNTADKTRKASERGYKFNLVTGEQIAYVFETETKTSSNFDRVEAIALLKKFQGKADALSKKVEEKMLEADIDFTSPITIYDSTQEIVALLG